MFSEPSATRRDSLSQARGVVQGVIAIVEDNNASARDRAYALLSEPQLAKAKDIQAKAEKERFDEDAKTKSP